MNKNNNTSKSSWVKYKTAPLTDSKPKSNQPPSTSLVKCQLYVFFFNKQLFMLRHLSHILRHPILDDQNHQHHHNHNHNLSVDEMNLKDFISNLFPCLKKSLRGGRAAGESAEDADGSGADSWNLFFDLRTLQVATNFFSDLNQLGHGGFGPVYRVRLYHNFFF